MTEAENIFEGAGVKITTAGKKHLGAAIGTIDYKEEFMTSLVRKWIDQIETLSKIAAFEPHTAYAAFTSCNDATIYIFLTSHNCLSHWNKSSEQSFYLRYWKVDL